MAPKPPSVRTAPGNPSRSSVLLGAPRWPPNPQRSDHPGKPGPVLCLVGGPEMAPKPPSVRTGPGNPWRSSVLVSSVLVLSVGQDVPPDADAGEHDHHEQYPLEGNARQPLAREPAQLR